MGTPAGGSAPQRSIQVQGVPTVWTAQASRDGTPRGTEGRLPGITVGTVEPGELMQYLPRSDAPAAE